MKGGAFGLPSLPKVGNPLTKGPLGTGGLKGAAAAAAGTAAAGLKGQVTAAAKGKLTEATEAAKRKATAELEAGKEAAVAAARKLEEEAKEKATREALRQAGLSEGQIDAAQKGTSYMGGINKTKDALLAFGASISLFFKNYWMYMLAVVVVALLGYYLYTLATAPTPASADKTASALAAAGKEGFEDAAATSAKAGDSLSGPTVGGGSLAGTESTPLIPREEELTFVNAQMKTIKQAGYAGPPTGGKFDPEELTAQALKAGFRAFVLQIDSVKTGMDPKVFPEPGAPTLLYRGDDGTLLSANAGSIELVAKMIASLAFRPEVPDYTMPVILYLHVLAAPSPVRKQEEYIRFLSRIARALNPLAPFHLGSTPMGVFHRQKREVDLLHAPIKSLEGQVIILSNADTTLFRAPLTGGKRYDPADDLDYWVNMRVTLENEEETHGIAKYAEKGEGSAAGPAAVVASLSNLVGLGAAKRDAFATRGKSRFVIAMPGAMANPSPAEVDRALKDLGVNMVPLDIFGVPLEESKKLVELYEGKAYLSKPAALRVRS